MFLSTRNSTRSWRFAALLCAVALLSTVIGCGDRECETDADCGARQVCVSSGGVLFDGATCVPISGLRDVDAATVPDAGVDMRISGCFSADDAEACAELNKNCGTVAFIDDCLGDRSLECGTCDAPDTCGGAGEANVCGCEPESDQQFCERLVKSCGAVSEADNCGFERTVDCGVCTAPAECGGGGTDNVCACADQSDIEFCEQYASECGRVDEIDECGQMRSVNCGGCPADEVCVTNLCVSDADSDGVVDAVDNCPDDANADQEDSDGDGSGDACDLCIGDDTQGDFDGDDVCDGVDADDDGDGVLDDEDSDPFDPDRCRDVDQDQCDDCSGGSDDPADDGVDSDDDGLCDQGDNCPLVSNPDQTDADGDGAGDACDPTLIASDETAATNSDQVSGLQTSTYSHEILTLVFTATTSSNNDVIGVNGGGLSFSRLTTSCVGQSQEKLEVWIASGVPQQDAIIVNWEATAGRVAASMVQASGVDSSVGAFEVSNVGASDGGCYEGSDLGNYSLDVPTAGTQEGFVVGGVAYVGSDLHTTTGATTTIEDYYDGTLGLATVYRTIGGSSQVSLEGDFGDPIRWAIIGVEILPR